MSKNNYKKTILHDYLDIGLTQIDIVLAELIKKTNNAYDQIYEIDLNNANNYSVLIAILSDTEYEITSFIALCTLFQCVHPIKQFREKWYNARQLMCDHRNLLKANNKMYKLLEKVSKLINGDGKIFLQRLLLFFKKYGAHLPDNICKEAITIKAKINIIEQDILKNMILSEKSIPVTCHELEGVPEYILKQFIRQNEVYYIPMTKTIYMTCLKYIKNNDTRKKIDGIYNTRCSDNAEKFIELFVLRYQYAKLFSYDTFTDMQICNQTAKSSENVKEFLRNLIVKLDPLCESEINVLRKIKELDTPDNNSELYSWDIPYYINLWKTKREIDDIVIREYFPLNHVVKEIIKLLETTLSLIFVQIIDPVVWNSDVQMYCIKDRQTQQIFGYVYLDLLMREGKPRYPICIPISPHCAYPLYNNTNNLIPCCSVLVGCYQKDQLLLSHQEVLTLLKEFGHLIHFSCCRTKYSIFNSIYSEDDFTETVAQLFEFYGWNQEIIQKLSSHYKTNECLPTNIINKIIKSKIFDLGINYKYRCFYASYDQLVHTEKNIIGLFEQLVLKKNNINNSNTSLVSMINIYKKLYAQIMSTPKNSTLISFNEYTFPPGSWVNLINGLEGLNYSSLWSEVYASDIYYEGFKKKLLDTDTGLLLREKVLGPGSIKPGNELVTNFLNRKINPCNFTDFIQTNNSELTERTLIGDTEDDFNYVAVTNKKYTDDNDNIIDTMTSKTNDFREVTITETTVKDDKKNNNRRKINKCKMDSSSVFIKCPKN